MIDRESGSILTGQTDRQRKDTRGFAVGKRPVLKPPTARSGEPERMRQSSIGDFNSSGIACPECERGFKSQKGLRVHTTKVHTERPWRDEETLKELLERHDYRFAVVAEELGTTGTTISRWSDKHGLGKPWHNPDTLRQLYTEQGLSSVEIGEKLGVTNRTVLNQLERFGIPKRDTIAGKSGDDHPMWDGGLREVNCDQCGKPKEVAPGIARKDKKHFCDLVCAGRWQSENVVGENHPNWNEEPAHPSFGPNWEEQREKRIEMDGGVCQICGIGREEHKEEFDQDINVHHITPRERFVGEDGVLDYERANKVSNLITLCLPHHRVWERFGLIPEVIR